MNLLFQFRQVKISIGQLRSISLNQCGITLGSFNEQYTLCACGGMPFCIIPVIVTVDQIANNFFLQVHHMTRQSKDCCMNERRCEAKWASRCTCADRYQCRAVVGGDTVQNCVNQGSAHASRVPRKKKCIRMMGHQS